MVWFKVDDSFYDHPKVFDAPDCAVALWSRAGSWCARNLTDGFVPSGMPARLCEDPERAVRELVDRRMWRRAKGGYQFHEWEADGDGSERNPTASEVKERRAKRAEAGRQGGLASGRVRRQQGSKTEASASAHSNNSRGRAPNARSKTEANANGGPPSRTARPDGIQPDSGAELGESSKQTGSTCFDDRSRSVRDPLNPRPDPVLINPSLSVSTTSRECLAGAGIEDEREIDQILNLIRAENPGIRNEAAYVAKLVANGHLLETRRRAAQPASPPRSPKAEAYVNGNRHAFQTVEDPPLSDSACTQCPLPPSHDIHRSARTAPGGDAA